MICPHQSLETIISSPSYHKTTSSYTRQNGLVPRKTCILKMLTQTKPRVIHHIPLANQDLVARGATATWPISWKDVHGRETMLGCRVGEASLRGGKTRVGGAQPLSRGW
jgi:hypothetical protein